MPGHGLPTAEDDKFIDECKTYFLGEPNKLLNAKEGAEDEAAAEEEAPAEEEEGEEGAEK